MQRRRPVWPWVVALGAWWLQIGQPSTAHAGIHLSITGLPTQATTTTTTTTTTIPATARPAPASTTAPPSASAAQAVAYALAQRGKPYQWGAEGPDAFDCSGLTYQAW